MNDKRKGRYAPVFLHSLVRMRRRGMRRPRLRWRAEVERVRNDI